MKKEKDLSGTIISLSGKLALGIGKKAKGLLTRNSQEAKIKALKEKIELAKLEKELKEAEAVEK